MGQGGQIHTSSTFRNARCHSNKSRVSAAFFASLLRVATLASDFCGGGPGGKDVYRHDGVVVTFAAFKFGTWHHLQFF